MASVIRVAQNPIAFDVQHATLAEAYRLKETFRDVYRQPSKANARGMLKAWVASAYGSGIAAMRTKGRGYRTMQNLRLIAFLVAGKLDIKLAA